jgi:hypothetical protein
MNYDKARRDLDAVLKVLMTDKKMRESDKLLIAHDDAWRASISKTLKGKTLEELLGEERAAAGKEARRKAATKLRPKKVTEKILETKRAKGTYEDPNHGMRNKKHSESTKEQQSTKAQIRQNLKRKLGLGRNDSVPPELLAKEYKKAGLI